MHSLRVGHSLRHPVLWLSEGLSHRENVLSRLDRGHGAAGKTSGSAKAGYLRILGALSVWVLRTSWTVQSLLGQTGQLHVHCSVAWHLLAISSCLQS